jgi:predicted nucleic acid-binding protein
LRAYFDTSAVIALFQEERHSPDLIQWIGQDNPSIHFSDFGALEFAAVVSRSVRSKRQTERWAAKAMGDFDSWRRDIVELTITSIQVGHAERLIRDFRSKLSAADALHVALAASGGLTLITFDKRMADAARMNDLAVLIPS